MVLHAALKILNEEERQIVLLRTSAGLKHREIAADLEMPLATVLSKYNRAMEKTVKTPERGGSTLTDHSETAWEQDEIESHLRSAMDALTPNVFDKIDLSTPQEIYVKTIPPCTDVPPDADRGDGSSRLPVCGCVRRRCFTFTRITVSIR